MIKQSVLFFPLHYTFIPLTLWERGKQVSSELVWIAMSFKGEEIEIFAFQYV